MSVTPSFSLLQIVHICDVVYKCDAAYFAKHPFITATPNLPVLKIVQTVTLSMSVTLLLFWCNAFAKASPRSTTNINVTPTISVTLSKSVTRRKNLILHCFAWLKFWMTEFVFFKLAKWWLSTPQHFSFFCQMFEKTLSGGF
jgi:hypothetical protein